MVTMPLPTLFSLKHASPRQLSLFVAIVASMALSLVAVVVFLLTLGHVPWTAVLLLVLVFFPLMFTLVRVSTETFVYRKIKLVYKTIHRLKARSPEDPGLLTRIRAGGDVIGQVNEEVIAWANRRRAEIEELKTLESYRRDFIGNLSHELKTPIFNIQGYVSTLADGGYKDEDIAEKYLRSAETNIERMISLVEDLDTMYKLESGRLQLVLESLDIVDLVRQVMEMLELPARQRDVTLKFKDAEPTPFQVMADRNAIQQVMTNLLMNSIVYGKEGGCTKVSFYDMDEVVLVEVTDDGPGIEEKHLPRLFERFYRIDKSRARHQGGTGLGLAIVKHMIEAHGQTIYVRSLVGRGSTFSFTLAKALN